MITMQSRATTSAVDLLLQQLEAEGVEYVFGIPGGPLMPLYEALFDRKRIKSVVTRHEGGASFMADGYARVSGRLGVCCSTTGPGATNALTGIACAKRDSVPVLLITAQVAISAFGKGAAQESSPLGIDIVDLYKAATKASLMLVSSEKMAEMSRHLLRCALSGRPGPVHLSLPADMAKQPVSCRSRQPAEYRSSAESFDRASIREAAKRLLRSRKPAILAGYGVHLSRSYAELRGLAERLAIPVATTPKGKGVFPEDHILSLGVFGFAGSRQADEILLSKENDLLLVVGSSFGEFSTHGWNEGLLRGKSLLQVDVDPGEIGKNYPVEVAMVGDCRQVLAELGHQLSRDLRWLENGPDRDGRLAPLRAFKLGTPRFLDPAAMEDDAVPLKPQRVMAELRRGMRDDAILFVDIGAVSSWALHYYTVREPGTFFINMGFCSMGHGVAAPIGGKLAAPGRQVVALVGDGAFAMNGMEVHTAVENDIPVVWVVLNNGGLGMVRLGEKLLFQGKFDASTYRRPLEIAKLAQAMGALAFRVERPGETEAALKQALDAGVPAVIEVLIDPEAVSPVVGRMETVKKFFTQAQTPVS